MQVVRLVVSLLVAIAAVCASHIKVCSHNLQRFGPLKVQQYDGKILSVILQEIASCDIFIALEMTDLSQKSYQILQQQLYNRYRKLKFLSILSPTVGSGRYTEQVAVFYRADKVELIGSAELQIEDANRNPYAVQFQVKQGFWFPVYFKFMLICVHTSPDNVLKEMKGLDQRYSSLLNQEAFNDYSSIVVVGDLNADTPSLTVEDKKSLQMFDADKYYEIITDGGSTMTQGATVKKYDRAFTHQVFKHSIVPQSGRVMRIGSPEVRGINMHSLYPRMISDHYAVMFTLDTSKVIRDVRKNMEVYKQVIKAKKADELRQLRLLQKQAQQQAKLQLKKFEDLQKLKQRPQQVPQSSRQAERESIVPELTDPILEALPVAPMKKQSISKSKSAAKARSQINLKPVIKPMKPMTQDQSSQREKRRRKRPVSYADEDDISIGDDAEYETDSDLRKGTKDDPDFDLAEIEYMDEGYQSE
ncbi:hypothetical protein MP228_013013 [Amoeboaphelidium protococcarum]|nr:hypothetical protein MP228_013013 [Amoeboaphelidium protococcarum]